MGREYVEELKNRVLNGGAEITYDEALKLAHEDLDILAASANEIKRAFLRRPVRCVFGHKREGGQMHREL